MNDSENFLARWSRLKRETALEQNAVSKQAPIEDSEPGSRPVGPPFDPTTLPSIELIDATTDIRPFLEDNVPEELTRAALRNTWSADPAIRDFVGIAENQWDFNDTTSIPGFGAVTAADYLGHLLVQGVRELATPIARLPEQSEPSGNQTLERFSPSDCEPAEGPGVINIEVRAPFPDAAESVSAGRIHASDSSTNVSNTDAEPGSSPMHSHGGALPK